MEPVVGIEPTTYGLQNRCSASELNWRDISTPTYYILWYAPFWGLQKRSKINFLKCMLLLAFMKIFTGENTNNFTQR